MIGSNDPIFAKLDVEGYEEEVLLGGQALLSKELAPSTHVETVTARSGEILLKNRFARVFYDPFQRLLSTDPISITSSNALFVRDLSFVRNRLREAPKIRVLNDLI